MSSRFPRTLLRHATPCALIVSLCLTLPSTAQASDPVPQDFVFISDTQYPWTEKSDSGEAEEIEETKRRSKLFINDQARATMEYRMENGGLDNVPLFINGDVTAYGHGWQRDFMYRYPFKDFYRRNFYVNLGNHDYQNNIRNGSSGCFNNGCARDMYKDMVGWAKRYSTRAFDHSSRDMNEGSLAYSLVIGDILAIQLQNEPTYSVIFKSDGKTFNISESLDFLEEELTWAREAGKDVILNMHKPPYANWQSSGDLRFKKLMKDNEDLILGIFSGHLHGTSGLHTSVGTIPVYLSGASYRQTFLTAHYIQQDRELFVFKVSNNDWRNNRKLVGSSKATAPRALPAGSRTDRSATYSATDRSSNR